MAVQRSNGDEPLKAALARGREELMRASTTERVAGLLRTHILEGLFPPGSRLSEELLVQALGVSRNTLREAFRLLAHERLTVHEMNRGTFVPVLTAQDVADIYRLRRLIECGAARDANRASPSSRQKVLEMVEEAEAAAERHDWLAVRTADLRFHQAIVALAGVARIDDLMQHTLAELRLAFHVMVDPAEFHRPYLTRNRRIAELVIAGRGAEAEAELESYLVAAEHQILASQGDPAHEASRPGQEPGAPDTASLP